MVPDFVSYIQPYSPKTFAHTWLGALCVDLPLGMVLLFVFHNLVKRPIIEHLPVFLRRRFICYRDIKWNRYFLANIIAVVACMMAGIATHLLWDMFTHSDPGAEIGRYDRVVVLQTVNSIIGVIIIIWVIGRMPTYKVPRRPIAGYWLCVLLSTIIVIILRFGISDFFAAYHHSLGDNAFISMCLGSFLLGIAIISLVFSLVNQLAKKR